MTRDDINAWHRVDYACNPEKKERVDAWRKQNPDKVKAYNQKSYLKVKSNPQKMAARAVANKAWRERNMDRVVFYNHQRARKLRGLSGGYTYDQWLAKKAEYNCTCPCCGLSEPEIVLTQDHIVPVAKGGTNFIWNIQPLCGPCNARKYTKIIFYSIKYHVRNRE
jgi:5-methylcytosine-specific restriction endonuclease McrA